MAHHQGASQASQIIFLEAKLGRMEDERHALYAKLQRLRDAVAFLDRCRDNYEVAKETGAMNDAHEWLEAAAREVAAT